MSDDRYLIDPYLDWVNAEGVPVHESLSFELFDVQTEPWARMGGGARAAFVHLEGRGDFASSYLLDLPPGCTTEPQRHLAEAVVYVLSGSGSTAVRTAGGQTHDFEWGEDSLFALPPNCRYRYFNTSGRDTARLAVVTNLPLVLNAFHDPSFVFDNDHDFSGRLGEAADAFSGDGRLVSVRPGRHQWVTNLVPNLRESVLQQWDKRGAGSANMKFVLADGTMHAHMSELAVGTYKKAHRHGPDFHIFPVTGEGYSLLWHEGDEDFRRIDWSRGSLYAPTDMLYHQHFNVSNRPARYLAVAFGSIKYPFVHEKKVQFGDGVDRDVRTGGRQIEYEQEDPRVWATFRESLAERGVQPDPEFVEMKLHDVGSTA